MKKIIFFLSLAFLIACSDSHSPKPRGFFRIDLPEKEYVKFDSIFPYAFERPVYSRFEPDTREFAEPYWADLTFPQFRGAIHLSYKEVNSRDDLREYFEDARSFANKHIPKATAIRDELIIDEESQMYGMFYHLRGSEVASPIQFYVTDSTDHFLRGALYFNVTPNNDSLAPVIQFLEEDIRHMLNTMSWK